MFDISFGIFVENSCSDYKEPNRTVSVSKLNYDNVLGVSEEFEVVNHWHWWNDDNTDWSNN